MSMDTTKRILLFKAGLAPEVRPVPETLYAAQRLIDCKMLEGIPLSGGIYIMCDEEGLLEGKPANYPIVPWLRGDFYVTRIDDDNDGEDVGLHDGDIDALMLIFAQTQQLPGGA